MEQHNAGMSVHNTDSPLYPLHNSQAKPLDLHPTPHCTHCQAQWHTGQPCCTHKGPAALSGCGNGFNSTYTASAAAAAAQC